MGLQFVIFVTFVSCTVQGFIFSKECGSDTCTSSESCIELPGGKQCINNDDLDHCGALSVCLLPTTCCNTFYCCPDGSYCANDPSSPLRCIRGVRSTTQSPKTTAKPTYRSTKQRITRKPTTSLSTSRTTRRPYNGGGSSSYSSSSSTSTVRWYYFFIPIASVILLGVIIAIVCSVRRSRGQQGDVIQTGGNQAMYSAHQGRNAGGQGTMSHTNQAYSSGPDTSTRHPHGGITSTPVHGGINTLNQQHFVHYNNAGQSTNITANTPAKGRAYK